MRTEEYIFEVFNKEVHQLLKENKEHPEYSDFWANRRIFSIEAKSRNEATEKIRKKYPADKGFVVTLK